jgi:hypothetical protein
MNDTCTASSCEGISRLRIPYTLDVARAELLVIQAGICALGLGSAVVVFRALSYAFY